MVTERCSEEEYLSLFRVKTGVMIVISGRWLTCKKMMYQCINVRAAGNVTVTFLEIIARGSSNTLQH